AVYQFVLFPLNDLFLHDDVIYAWGSSTIDYDELRAAFPGRKLYLLNIGVGGQVTYTPAP
ncbi:MAG TPA: hypothetical protein VGN34_01150, partial [Ktedonobacteraceae bacterium]